MNPQLAVAITAKNQTKPAFDAVVSDANRVGAALTSQGGRAAAAMNGTSFATANVAAQLNDIGVMMASGQSPLILAIQQGTQLNQVFTGMSGGQVLGALKTAFLSLVNPISLITIGTIAASAALFQYLTSLNTDGKQATEVIKEQNDLIRRVAQNWGEAVPSLKAYVDELDRAASVSDLNKATEVLVDEAFAEARSRVSDLRVELAAARTDIQAVGGTADEIDALQSAFSELEAKIADGSVTSADLDTVLSTLAGTTGAETVPTMKGFRDVLVALIPVIAAAAARTGQLNAELAAVMMQGPDPKIFYDQQEFIAEQERLNALTAEQLSLEREMDRVRGEAKSGDVILTEQQVLNLAQQRLAAEERRRQLAQDDRSGAKSISDLEREQQAVAALISELEHEQSLMGLSAVDKEVANALRRAGAAATDEERKKIEALVRVMAEQEAMQKIVANETAFYRATVGGFVNDLTNGLRQGKDFWTALGDAGVSALDKIADRAMSMALDGIFDMIFGAAMGGGGWGGNPFSLGAGGPGFLGGGASAWGSWEGGGYTWDGPRTGGVDGRGGRFGILHPNETVIDHSRVPLKSYEQGNEGRALRVEIYNEGGQPVAAKSATMSSENGVEVARIIIGTVKNAIADGSLDGALRGAYGLGRKGI